MKNNVLINICIAGILFIPYFSRAEMTHGEGEFIYDRNTSEAEACRRAEELAINDAISKVQGVSIYNNRQKSCKNASSLGTDATSKEVLECQTYKDIFVFTNYAEIKPGSIRNKIVKPYKKNDGDVFSVCEVSFDAEVISPKEKADSNFQVTADINKREYKNGDTLILQLSSNTSAFFAAFNHTLNDGKITNITDVIDGLTSSSFLVKDKAKEEVIKRNKDKYNHKEVLYEKTLQFDVLLPKINNSNFYIENIIIVFTKKQITWSKSYSVESLEQKIQEIPLNERQVSKLLYTIKK